MGLIQDIADLAPAKTKQPRAQTRTFGLRIPGASPSNNGSRLDVPRWLTDRNVEYRTKSISGGTAYIVQCPFNESHGNNGESAVFQGDDGLLTFDCKHNSCQGRRWADYRDAIGKPEPDHYDPPLNSRLATEQQQTTSPDTENEDACQPWKLKSLWNGVANPSPMREVIIEGLARRGEVVNIVAATKVGKSWLALLLAFSVATGREWLRRHVAKGRVLLIDNELHDETIQNRAKAVADAIGAGVNADNAPLDYIDVRGESLGIGDIELQLSEFKPGELVLVILDAKYRFFGCEDENSNSAQTLFHNAVDRLAKQLDCVIVLVHHATKGNQSSKAVTDVGSGGGAQSRTVDCHLVIRPHIESDLAVLDASVRTFAPVPSQTLRWAFPLWTVDEFVEPVLKQARTTSDSRQEAKDKDGVAALARVFHEFPGEALSRYEIHQQFGGGKERVNRLLRLAIDEGLIVRIGSRIARNGSEIETFALSGAYHFSEARNDDKKKGLFERSETTA